MKIPFMFLVLLIAGCSGTQEVAVQRPLPFHAALLPLEINSRPGAPARGELEEDTVVEDVRLAFDEAAATQRLSDILGESVFVRTSVMTYPQNVDRETFLSWTPETQDNWWVEAAAGEDADLIVAAVLNFRTQVRTDINSDFWLNLPLFLLGGPMTWFVNDRSYFLEAQLTAEVYAVDPLANQLATLSDGRTRLQSVRATADEVPLDFIDRADHGGQYLLSIVVPSGLLATDTESVSTYLRDAVMTVLEDGLARDIQTQAERLVLADRMVDFFLRPDELVVVANGAGHELHGNVYLERRQGAVASMKEGRLSWAGGEEFVNLDEREVVTGDSRRNEYYRYGFVFHLPEGEALPDFARLELVDGSSDGYRRTYLLPVRSMVEQVYTGANEREYLGMSKR